MFNAAWEIQIKSQFIISHWILSNYLITCDIYVNLCFIYGYHWVHIVLKTFFYFLWTTENDELFPIRWILKFISKITTFSILERWIQLNCIFLLNLSLICITRYIITHKSHISCEKHHCYWHTIWVRPLFINHYSWSSKGFFSNICVWFISNEQVINISISIFHVYHISDVNIKK